MAVFSFLVTDFFIPLLKEQEIQVSIGVAVAEDPFLGQKKKGAGMIPPYEVR